MRQSQLTLAIDVSDTSGQQAFKVLGDDQLTFLPPDDADHRRELKRRHAEAERIRKDRDGE